MRNKSAKRVVLTGGPGGGKTSFLKELRQEDPHAKKWLIVPEAASVLLQAGLTFCSKEFELEVVHLQIFLEDTVSRLASPGQVVLCDRGTLDALAFWQGQQWNVQEFFTATRKTLEQHMCRYSGVLHMQTTAIGAVPFYKYAPEAFRTETPGEAAALDELCAAAWSDHDRYVFVANDGCCWADKSRKARELLDKMICWI